MPPHGKYIGIQLFGAALWMIGFLALFANDLRELILAWFVVCAGIMISSWWVVCPRCGASVYRSALQNFFAVHRWFRNKGTEPCHRCNLDLKSKYVQ